jgi:hypothetical protein
LIKDLNLDTGRISDGAKKGMSGERGGEEIRHKQFEGLVPVRG